MADLIPRALIEHLLVDAPTEEGLWCPVNAEGVGWPVEVNIYSVYDDDGDPTGRTVAYAYHHGVEDRTEVSTYRDVQWLRLDAIGAELERAKILAAHLERGPLSWDDVGWDSSTPDVVRIGLREEGGALRTALIPVEKAALVGAAAALARPTKRPKRAKVERTNRADVRLTPAASQIVADEGLLRDDVAALLGRYTKIARTLEIAAGRGTIREAREAAGLSLGQAVRLVPWDRAHMEAIEATGVMLPEERAALCSVYGVAGFVDEFGMQGGER